MDISVTYKERATTSPVAVKFSKRRRAQVNGVGESPLNRNGRYPKWIVIWSILISDYEQSDTVTGWNLRFYLNTKDEALHGVAVGLFAQRLFDTFTEDKQNELKVWGYETLLDLYENECKYTEDVYAETGLSAEVKRYVRYNANKAMMNLGWDTMFEEEEVNPIVLNGINTQGSTMDFFSQKGIYTIAKVAPITDDTFKVLNGIKTVKNK